MICPPSNRTHKIKRGDTARKFIDAFTIEGDPIDLTGATVKFILKNIASGEVFTRNATITDAAEGEVEYQPIAADVATVGRYVAEWEITYTGGKKQTVPEEHYINIEVKADLG